MVSPELDFVSRRKESKLMYHFAIFQIRERDSHGLNLAAPRYLHTCRLVDREGRERSACLHREKLEVRYRDTQRVRDEESEVEDAPPFQTKGWFEAARVAHRFVGTDLVGSS